MILLSLVLTSLAVARVTRLIYSDYISMPIRQWVMKRNGEEGWWTFGIHCPKCVSVWVAAPAAAIWQFSFGPDLAIYKQILLGLVVWMAFSYTTILLEDFLERVNG